MSELAVGRYPDRKGTYLYYLSGNTSTVLARFINPEAAEMFLELAERGITRKGDDERQESEAAQA